MLGQVVSQLPDPVVVVDAVPPPEPKKTPVDVRTDRSYHDDVVNKRYDLPEQAMFLVGNVVFHHNGAVISCDSAIQYSARHIECFDNVIINQDSTFVYGDRAVYNGEENFAQVFSPVIKVVDGTSTLYTYGFSFNTLDRIGRWFGGGVVYQDDNVLESERGYYYSNLHEMVAVEAVEMRNDTHRLTSDSVRYNTDTRVATFYTPTNIWTNNDEIISARQGQYFGLDSLYFFHDNAYVLTPTREVWADTIDYNGLTGNVVLTGNAQVDDGENRSSLFGDYIRYWGTSGFDSLAGRWREKGEGMMTRRPTVVNYQEQQGRVDTLYLRADTLFMYVGYRSLQGPTPDTLPQKESVPLSVVPVVDSLPVFDTLPAPVVDTVPPPALSKKERKALARELRRKEKDRQRFVKDSLREVRAEQKAAARRAKRGEVVAVVDSLAAKDSVAMADSLPTPEPVPVAVRTVDPAEPDTVLRTFRGWRNVKIWRRDMQAVADSIVGFSADSTLHLYQSPVLWHGDNQITSDSMTVWTANQKPSRAEFYVSPIMSMMVDDDRFNQVKSRTMVSHFRDGQLWRHDAVGNAEAVYYMQEDPPADTTAVFDPSPIAFVALSSSEISFLIDSAAQTVRYIVSREQPRSTVYPMDEIPVSEPTRLQGFAWFSGRRPALEDVFARLWRPSLREWYESLTGPLFPIAARIDTRRKYLIDNRMWIDRNEPLPAHAVEFRDERLRK